MTLRDHIRSVRFVLTVWYALVLLIASAIFGVSVYVYLDHLLMQTLRDDLTAEVDWIYQLIDIEQKKSGGDSMLQELPADVHSRLTSHLSRDPRNYIVVVTASNGSVLHTSQNGEDRYLPRHENLPMGKTVFSSFTEPENDESIQLATLKTGSLIIRVGFPERAIHVVLGHVVSILGLLTPVVILIAFSGGWLLAGAVLRPIGDITDRAARITAENLNQRIPPRDVDDELGRLITTINGMIARLHASFTQLREFSINLAHELKTPLTILKGESELALAQPLEPTESSSLATTYLEETSRMTRIIDDLLTLARAEAGQVSMEKLPVAMHDLVEEVYEDASILATGRNIAVVMGENPPVGITGDIGRLRQLFRNLVANAVRYTPATGTITILSRVLDGAVEVSVNDTGIGIPEDKVDRIFDRFYRVEEGRSRAQGGTGLGLSISRWIAESHGGRILVQSAPGRGSTFTVRLPLGQH